MRGREGVCEGDRAAFASSEGILSIVSGGVTIIQRPVSLFTPFPPYLVLPPSRGSSWKSSFPSYQNPLISAAAAKRTASFTTSTTSQE
jgi:hypothetical protein